VDVERVDRVHQAEDAGRHEIVEFDPLGESRPNAFAVVFHERQVLFDQAIAEILIIRIRLEFAPYLIDVGCRSQSRRHAILRDCTASKRTCSILEHRWLSLGRKVPSACIS
jgi:hypothetical protein